MPPCVLARRGPQSNRRRHGAAIQSIDEAPSSSYIAQTSPSSLIPALLFVRSDPRIRTLAPNFQPRVRHPLAWV